MRGTAVKPKRHLATITESLRCGEQHRRALHGAQNHTPFWHFLTPYPEGIMELKIVTWRITGTRPLMQSNPMGTMDPNTGTEGKVKSMTKHRDKPFDEAKKYLYKMADSKPDKFYHPGMAFYKSILDVCTGRTVAGVAASTTIPRAVMPLDQDFLLCDPETLEEKSPKPLKNNQWQMDTRRVVNAKVGALIVHRPKWKSWGGLISFEVDMEFSKSLPKLLTDLLNIGGRYGIGAGRMMQHPQSKKWGGLGLGKFTAELK
ncbi:MAG: hypothetical protein O7D91_21510 [Planctomycetota bacterium]|nr:hypothetical protein [Planctomycetota bacterium]